MAKIKEVDINGYPLDGSRILTQGDGEFIAVGPNEIGRLPKLQKNAVSKLPTKKPLSAFLGVNDGALHFTRGDAPIVASVDKKGGVTKHVDWI